MRFLAVHKVVSYLMTLTCLGALFASGELSLLVGVVTLAGAAVSWFWEPPRVRFERYQVLWNALTLIMLARTVFDAVTGGSLLVSATYFVVFLTVNKLFNRRASRDYQQLYTVGFLQMVAATVLNSDLSYGVLFVLYTVFITWCLILFHLKREMEENYLLKYGADSLEGRPVQIERVLNSRKLIGGRFLFATSLVSIVVFTGAATMFFLFPRVGFGYFFKKQRAGITMSGFSDRFELGQFGKIKDDPTVVLRAEFPDPSQRGALPLYWRGMTYDHYDGRQWRQSRAASRRRVNRGRDGRYPIARARSDSAVEQAIYLEPMETRVLFGLTQVAAVATEPSDVPLPRSRRRRIERDDDDNIYYQQLDQIAFRYSAYSVPVPVPLERLAKPLDVFRADIAAVVEQRGPSRFLQLPNNLDPRVTELAQQVVGDAKTVGEAVDRVERHLQTQYAYTLDLKRDERFSPLADFLFVQQQGHCEYFSTAMVVMLRTQGIPARSVNGFSGGVWNSFGNYLAVSQGDAHSWVEVWLGGELWQTRDPTPSGPGRGGEAGFMSKLRQYADALRLRWFKYVIEYDLQSQVGFVQDVRSAWKATFGGGGREGAAALRRIARKASIALVLVLLLAAAILLIRRRPLAGPAGDSRRRALEAAALFQALTDTYGRLGYARSPSTTASEFFAHLARSGAPELGLAEEVVTRYEASRFGGEDLPREQRQSLLSALKTLARSGPRRIPS